MELTHFSSNSDTGTNDYAAPWTNPNLISRESNSKALGKGLVNDTKRKSRNLSEKKRRDQFNSLIEELSNLIQPDFGLGEHQSASENDHHQDAAMAQQPVDLNETRQVAQQQQLSDVEELPCDQDAASNHNNAQQRKMDKSSVLKCTIEFLKKHCTVNSNADRQHLPETIHVKQQHHVGHLPLLPPPPAPPPLASNQVFVGSQFDIGKIASERSVPSKDDDLITQDETGCATTKSIRDGVDFSTPAAVDTSSWKPSYITDDEFSVQMIEALDAFIVVCEVNQEARIVYSSDTLTSLLSYTGTCNSLRHHDYVSFFDLIAPNDRLQVEKLFGLPSKVPLTPPRPSENQVPNDGLMSERSSVPALVIEKRQFKSKHPSKTVTNSIVRQDEYTSLSVNFRNGLNLTEIKQERYKKRAVPNNLQPVDLIYEKGRKPQQQRDASQSSSKDDSFSDRSAQQLDTVVDEPSEVSFELQKQRCNNYGRQSIQQQRQEQPSQPQQQRMIKQYNRKIVTPVESRNQLTGEDTCMQIVVESSTGTRNQQSISERQQHLMFEGLLEEQEHNQQQHHQQQQYQAVTEEEQKVSDSLDQPQVTSDDNQSSPDEGSSGCCNSSVDGSNVVTSGGSKNSSSTSGTNSDENDQLMSTGGEDASESNQSPTSIRQPEKRHHCRHHKTHQKQQQQRGSGSSDGSSGVKLPGHNSRRHHHIKTVAKGEQYELVQLTGTFKGFEDNTGEIIGSDNDRFEELNDDDEQQSALSQPVKKNRYFICIGRLDIPRFSYDLKIIVPPSRGGTNVFHNNQFLSKHTLKWRFLWIDNKAPAIIGYLPFEVLGTSCYDYYHWDDLDKIVISHEGLMRDGQASSGPYRFLTKGQQWIWLKSKYCIILKPQFYVEQRKQQEQQRLLSDCVKVMRSNQLANIDKEDQILSSKNETSRVNKDRKVSKSGKSYSRSSDVSVRDLSAEQVVRSPRYSLPSYQGTACKSPKKFCSDQSNVIVKSNHSSGTKNSAPSQFNKLHNPGDPEEKSDESRQQSRSEQRRYEKLIKSNDLLKNNSIKAGNSFSSRSLDQFKFILCTHTVIGFDEDETFDLTQRNLKSQPIKQQQHKSVESQSCQPKTFELMERNLNQ